MNADICLPNNFLQFLERKKSTSKEENKQGIIRTVIVNKEKKMLFVPFLSSKCRILTAVQLSKAD